jgi:aspartate oxidase
MSTCAVDTLLHARIGKCQPLQVCEGVPRIPSPKDGKPMPVGVAIIRALKAHLDTLAEVANKAGRSVQIVTGKSIFFITPSTVVQVHKCTSLSTTRQRRAQVSRVCWRLCHNIRASKPKCLVDSRAKALAHTHPGTAVILTTGGFGSDRGAGDNSLMKEFAPQLIGYSTTNGVFAQGDGMRMARAAGARLRDMGAVQVRHELCTSLLPP